jgi:hypothetical protein
LLFPTQPKKVREGKLLKKGKTSKMLEVALEEKRREIIKEWINSRRIPGGLKI